MLTIFFGLKKFVITPRHITITKGLVGQPRFLNPLYAELNPVDKEISKLLFRGLVSYNEQGEIVGDLAESWEISEDGKVYTLKLKPNLTWHDGEKFRADDVVFTYQLTKESDYQGPEKESFAGVNIEKIDEQTVKFTLKEPFAPFLERITLGILPKHKLFEIPAKELPKNEFNLSPIGTGDWKFNSFELNKTSRKFNNLTIQQSNNLTILSFRFYDNEQDLLTAYKLGEINTFTTINLKLIKELESWQNTEISSQTLNNTHFALFLNLKGKEILQSFGFRKALAFAIDKSKLDGKAIEGVIPISSWAYSPDTAKYAFDQEKSKSLLNEFEQEHKTVDLKFCESPFCEELAEEVADFWKRVGVQVVSKKLTSAELTEVINNRDFEILLLQQDLSSDPDQYALWHSSQIEPPGLNITGINNRRIDKFLTDGRKSQNQDERKSAYSEVQKEIANELPAIFLIQPKLCTISNKKLSL